MRTHDIFSPSVTVHLGDCLDVMPTIPDNSVDAVVCDPPYHLTSIVKRFGAGNAAPNKDATFGRISRGFMGKEWDGGDIAFRVETWAHVLRILKPGGHLLAFSGSRTYHRMVVAIEDAGFEIRDQIMWVYGSGFPKSHDVSKGIDKAAGAVRDKTPTEPMITGTEIGKISKNLRCAICGKARASGNPCVCPRLEDDPITPDAQKWQGWGSALKPAHEPIVMARKPLIGTIVENVLEHGTGAINIDGCRVPTDEQLSGGAGQLWSHARDGTIGTPRPTSKIGRFPANLIHDGSDEVVDIFPREAGARAPVTVRNGDKFRNTYGAFKGNIDEQGSTFQGDTGSAARFFYCAKASAVDRAGSKHPTVKPISLMRYLVRMVTPRNGLVLDPFAGSGTTLMAAKLEGFNSIGIEQDAQYYSDIRQRFGQ